MKQQVIINIGVSGSGKTTWSTNFIKKNPKYFRINRDDIRKMLVGTLEGYYSSPEFISRETYVSEIEEILFVNSLGKGKSVILDNTHLKPSYIQKWVDFVAAWNEDLEESEKVDFVFAIFQENNIQELKKRVNVRDAPSSWKALDYIDKQATSIRSAVAYATDNYPNNIIFITK